MAAERDCVMIHQAVPTVEYILTEPSTAGGLAVRYLKKKQPSGSSALLDVGRRFETLSRKT